MALIPARGDGPDEQVERREDDRPQPRGAAGAEAGRAAGPGPARRGLLLRRDRRADRLQPDQNQSPARRGQGPLPRARLQQRGRQPLPRAAAAALGVLRRRGQPSRDDRSAGAPARLRPLPRDDADLPRGAAGGGSAVAPAAALALAAGTSAGAGRQSGARLPGFGGGESVATQVAAAGGSRGAGMAAIAKLLTVCAGAAGGAAACVATGVLPAPVLAPEPAPKPAIERPAAGRRPASEDEAVDYQPAPPRDRSCAEQARAEPAAKEEAAAPVSAEPSAATAGAVEYEAPAPARRTAEQQRSRARPELERLRGRGVRPMSAGRTPCNALRSQQDEKRCTSAIALALSRIALVCPAGGGGLHATHRPAGRRRGRQLASPADVRAQLEQPTRRRRRPLPAAHRRRQGPDRRHDPALGSERDRASQRAGGARRLHRRGLARGRERCERSPGERQAALRRRASRCRRSPSPVHRLDRALGLSRTRSASAIQAAPTRSPASAATPSRSTLRRRALPAPPTCSGAETDLQGGVAADTLPIAELPRA